VSAVSLRGLTVARGGVDVVRDVSLELSSGSWTMLVGPNGAGKSTIIAAIAGLLEHRGALLIDDTDVSKLGVRQRAQLVAFVPQRPQLPVGMAVHDYIMLGRTAHRSLFATPRAGDERVVREVVERLDLGWLLRRSVHELSGGELQRATIARALAQQARVVLLDEPTSALDIAHQQQAMLLVDSLRRNDELTICSAMHDLTLATQFGDQVAILTCGELRAAGPPRSVVTAAGVRDAYGVDVSVMTDPDGHLVVVPRRTPTA
jgi:iron complex transport system ATP-binding protein